MPEPISASDAAVLQRRRFLRGGALLAAAAGGAAAASAGSVLPAAADDSDVVNLVAGIPPEKLLDTRTADGRGLIVGSSSSALDAKHRLKKNAWIDVAVFPADQGIELISAFVNVTSHSSAKSGALVATDPGGGKPGGWTLAYDKGKTVANSAIVGVGLSDDESFYTVRLYASSPTHITMNLTGVSALLLLTADDRTGARTSHRANVARITKAAKSVLR